MTTLSDMARPAVEAATILVVEDSPALREIARRVLERRGYVVLCAASGQEALRLFRAHGSSIDLVLSDVVMPGQSGPALAAQLTSERPGLRILHMSGYIDDAVALADPAAFLQKPFTPDLLVRKVREVLSAPAPLSAR
jgi:CheY-like chemotaxis protein